MICPSCQKEKEEQEIKSNSGVCFGCKSNFKKRHPNLNRYTEPTPIREHVVKEPTTFVDSHVESFEDFPFDIIDGHKEPDVKRIAAHAIAKSMTRLLESGKSQRRFYQMVHCLLFADHLHPMQDKSGDEIAKTIRMEKANFFKEVNKFRDRLQLPRIAGAKGIKARKTYSDNTRKNHDKRKISSRKTNGAFFAGLGEAYKRTGG